MKEFIEKLIERLKEIKTYYAEDFSQGYSCEVDCVEKYEVKKIVNQLAEEYNNDMVTQLAMMYAKNLYVYGVDVTKVWKTATSQSMALEQAYLRGRQYERDRFAEWQEEHNNGWIPCSERLPSKEEYLKDDGRFIVTDGNRRYQSIYDIYQGGFRTLKLFTNGGSERGWNFEEDNRVIAWQPLPAPYKEGK